MNGRSAIENPTKMKQILEFEIAFPKETPKTVEEYLRGGSKDLILSVATSFLGFKNQKSKFDNPKVALEMFFRKENSEFANQVYDKIKELNKEGKEILIFNTYSNLKLFEIFFKTTEEEVTQSEEEFEINIFKALLVLNSDYTKKQSVAFQSTKDLEIHLRFPMLMFCSFFATSDKVNYNLNEIWITQFVKSIYLFQFLEADVRTKQLLNDFLASFECSSWKEYLKRILPLTTSFIKKEKEAHTDIKVDHGKNFRKDCAFIEKLIVTESDDLESPDFLSLRSKPFYKIEDGVYRIILDLFVIEKIFTGVYFLLRDINQRLPKAKRVRELKSLFGYEFAEKILTYQILKLVYPDNCVSFTGDEMDKKGVISAPDYYVRRGKDILIFESKDFLIPAQVKDSFNYELYENEFTKKLYYVEENGNEKPKAVLQLINTVRKLLKNEFTLDSNYKYKEVRIYPVLITHDRQYDVGGFNNLINDWFQDELRDLEDEGLFIHKVAPLIIVSIDCLIYHQVPLVKRTTLHEMLNMYSDHIKNRPNEKYPSLNDAKESQINKMTPFSLFMNNYIMDRKWDEMPPILEDSGLILFDES